MRRLHSGYILAALVMSVVSHIVHIVSEMTQSWVVAETVPEDGYSATISFGLYQGSVVEKSYDLNEISYVLTITCLVYLNACAWSCESSDDLRKEQILTLYNTGQLIHPCSNRTQNYTLPVPWVRERFISGVAWLATVAAVVLSGLASLIALTLTAYNVRHTPSSYWLSIQGLRFWFGTSCVLSLLALGTWSVEFYFKLAMNVGTVDTIGGSLNTKDRAHLGYSYWLQFVTVSLRCGCVALLCYRETLFAKRLPFVGSLQRHHIALNYTVHF